VVGYALRAVVVADSLDELHGEVHLDAAAAAEGKMSEP
jgi:hypothetical protein